MIYNIYKPIGWTSFDVVKKIRNITQEKKVGHGGTLDPFAEGVLIIGTGKDTKALGNIAHGNKSYRGIIQLGQETDTLDCDGEVIKNSDLPSLTEENIKKVFNNFLGTQNQVPPMFSAKKINGIRLYKLARKKQVVDRDPVEITIFRLDLIQFNKTEIEFEVECSKGTYIRVLAKDISQALNTVGYLKSLVRTCVADFTVDDSMAIKTFQEKWKYLET